MAEIVGAVNEEKSVVFFADLLVGLEVWGVWVHWKQTFSDDKDGIFGIFGSDFFQKFDHFLLIEMCELVNIFGGGIGSFLEAIVGKSVHDDMVVFLDEGLDDTEASEPSSWVDEKRFDTPELSQLLFELHVIPE